LTTPLHEEVSLNSFLFLKKQLGLILLSFLFTLISPGQTLAQDEEEKFINIGLLGVSTKYTIPATTNTIVFRIKNNATRTISQIYGWVYRYDKEPDGKGKNFVLLNNPHKGGNIIKGNPHRPGTVSEWSFPLVRKASPPSDVIEYTLRVHSRSIFFANIEVGNKPEP